MNGSGQESSTPPEGIVLESRPCPLGCPPGDDFVLRARDLLTRIPGAYDIVRCRACGLMRTNPRPTPETIGLYYPESYGPYVGTTVRTREPPPAPRPRWKRVARAIVPRFDSRAFAIPPVDRPGRLLEIGCASGWYLDFMHARGWDVTGIEFSERAAARARALGFPVVAGALESAPDPQAAFDLIAGWMLVEHLHDPVTALRKLRRWIKPDGWFCFSVPNCAALEFKLFGRYCFATQLPTHLYHYTPATLARVLREGGWTLQRVIHQRNPTNLLVSLGYLLRERDREGVLSRWLIDFPLRKHRTIPVWNALGTLLAWLGQSGRMTVWARPAP